MTAKELEAPFEESANYKERRIERPRVRLIYTTHRWSGGDPLEEKLVCECGNDIFFCLQEEVRCGGVQDGVFLIQCSKCNAVHSPPYNYWKAVREIHK